MTIMGRDLWTKEPVPAETYRPGRDGRFEYANDACRYIEERQCSQGCAHGELKDGVYLCPVLLQICLTEPCEGVLGDGPDVLDLGYDGIRCTRQTQQVGPDLFGGES